MAAASTKKPMPDQILIDGSVILFLGAVEIGQGVRTALMQVAAEKLSVKPDRVQVAPLDSAYTPFDRGTHASSAITVMGKAVQAAAQDARAKTHCHGGGGFSCPIGYRRAG